MTCRSCAKARRILRELVDASGALARAEGQFNTEMVAFSRRKGDAPSSDQVFHANRRAADAAVVARTYLSEVKP